MSLGIVDLAKRVVTLTPTQVKALFSTPFELVPAPGVGLTNIVNRVSFNASFVSVAYAGANNLEFRYTNASGAKVTADIAAATLNFAGGNKLSTVASVTTELAPVSNAAIVVCVPSANPTAGDSPITIEVEYRLMSYTDIAAANVAYSLSIYTMPNIRIKKQPTAVQVRETRPTKWPLP